MSQNRRADLHHILEGVLGSKNVYFDPPEDFKLKYPCIVYSLEGHAERLADNKQYNLMRRYRMVYITQRADDPTVDALDELQYCSLSQAYVSSNLRHYAYTIFY